VLDLIVARHHPERDDLLGERSSHAREEPLRGREKKREKKSCKGERKKERGRVR
jgi:hypothetical protein